MADDDGLAPFDGRLERIEEEIRYWSARERVHAGMDNVTRLRAGVGAAMARIEHAIEHELAYDDLLASNRHLRGEIERLERELEAVRKQQRLDPLTQVYDRGGFEHALANEWARARRVRVGVALLFIDLDRFKSVNDTYGHPVGDAFLVHVAHAIERESKRAGEVVARYGGDEFVVLLPNTSAEEGAALAERIRTAIGEIVMVGPERARISISVSVGVASIVPDDRTGCEQLLRQADAAALKAKQSGRNEVIVATQEGGDLVFSTLERAPAPRTPRGSRTR